MAPDAPLMGILGSAFRIFIFSAIALFVLALVGILWLCVFEPKKPKS
jgi:hypothetical protein